MRSLKTAGLSALSGIALALSLPNEICPWGNPLIGLMALVPLYLALDRTKGWRGAFWTGALFGALAHGLSSYWLWFFKDFRVWTLGSSVLAYAVVYGVLAMYLRGALRKGGFLRPLIFAAAWTVFEWSKSNGFLGYPWGLLPYSWNSVLPAIQIAEATGVYGLGFALAWVSAGLAEIVAPPEPAPKLEYCGPAPFLPKRASGSARPWLEAGHLVSAALLMVGIMAYGYMALGRDRAPRAVMTAAMVQQNLDSWEMQDGERRALETSIALARRALDSHQGPVDLVMFSETTLKRDYDFSQRYYATMPEAYSLAAFLDQYQVPLFTGAPEWFEVDGEWQASNSVILVAPTGEKMDSYGKMHPVPFAEAIPFWDVDAVRHFIQNVVGLQSGWTMGGRRTIFELDLHGGNSVRFGAPICFEDAFSYLCRRFVRDGAEVLVNLTNDSWSRTDSAEIQHFVAARFRSVELRRTLVRSTNGGVSAVVHPDGSVRDMMPLFEATSSVVDIPVYTGERTLYLILGDWFPALLAFLLALLAAIVYLGCRKAPVEPCRGRWHAEEPCADSEPAEG
ncbi:MAG: apolipoprotein N-acyltransferase [Spirochaetales bacterium]|nr:apolipoprotein N-acyltransferase [Spirochaetales bacterium]